MKPPLLVPLLVVCCTPRSVPSAIPTPASGWIDITAPIDPKTTPVYADDGTIKLEFVLSMANGDRLTLSSYAFGAHTGTHVDAPMHFIRDGASLDKVSLEDFIGPVRIIDCSPDATAIDAAELNEHPWQGAQRIFFRTRSSREHWMTTPAFHKDLVYIAPDAALLLADAGVKLVGIDYLSVEKFGATEPKTHRILLAKGIPIIEGAYLDDVKPGDYDLMLLPLRIVGHEASPVRALIRPVNH